MQQLFDEIKEYQVTNRNIPQNIQDLFLKKEREEIESAFSEGLLLPEESDLNGHKYFELTYTPNQNG